MKTEEKGRGEGAGPTEPPALDHPMLEPHPLEPSGTGGTVWSWVWVTRERIFKKQNRSPGGFTDFIDSSGPRKSCART